MATAAAVAKTIPIPIDENTAPVAELLARFTARELMEAQQETSRQYDGLVLARAVVIVQCRIRCMSIQELARKMGFSRNVLYRWASGSPLGPQFFRRAIRELALLLAE